MTWAEQKSYNCQEGSRCPAIETYLYFHNNITICQEGTEMKLQPCFKCGKETAYFQHHISYKPEVLAYCCMSCHKKLHNKLRREGKCKIPSTELEKIRIQCASVKNRENNYHKQTRSILNFYENMMPYVSLNEMISYNNKTGNVSITVGFKAENKKKLLIIEE